MFLKLPRKMDNINMLIGEAVWRPKATGSLLDTLKS